MSFRITTTGTAKEQILAARDWWQLNREKAPDAFVVELRRAYLLLKNSPRIGRETVVDGKPLRSLLMRKTGHRVVYEIYDEEVVVIALVAMRTKDPFARR